MVCCEIKNYRLLPLLVDHHVIRLAITILLVYIPQDPCLVILNHLSEAHTQHRFSVYYAGRLVVTLQVCLTCQHLAVMCCTVSGASLHSLPFRPCLVW